MTVLDTLAGLEQLAARPGTDPDVVARIRTVLRVRDALHKADPNRTNALVVLIRELLYADYEDPAEDPDLGYARS